MTWSQFLEAHWDVLAAADFFTVEVWGLRNLVTFYVFFVIELESRRIEIAGITPGPNESWMMQIGRNVTDPIDGFLADKKYLILDRNSKNSSTFRDMLEHSGVKVVRLPYRSPNLNAYAERFVRSIKDECLNSTAAQLHSQFVGRHPVATIDRPGLRTARFRAASPSPGLP